MSRQFISAVRPFGEFCWRARRDLEPLETKRDADIECASGAFATIDAVTIGGGADRAIIGDLHVATEA